MEKDIFGYHLMIDASACDRQLIGSEENIRLFSKELVEAIGMTAYGNPQVVHFAAHNPLAGGYTLIQLIETSNISAHFVDSSGNAFLDVFSCMSFDKDVAVRVFEDHFKPQHVHQKFIVRSA